MSDFQQAFESLNEAAKRVGQTAQKFAADYEEARRYAYFNSGPIPGTNGVHPLKPSAGEPA